MTNLLSSRKAVLLEILAKWGQYEGILLDPSQLSVSLLLGEMPSDGHWINFQILLRDLLFGKQTHPFLSEFNSLRASPRLGHYRALLTNLLCFSPQRIWLWKALCTRRAKLTLFLVLSVACRWSMQKSQVIALWLQNVHHLISYSNITYNDANT